MCQKVLRGGDCGRGGDAPVASTVLHELVHEACYGTERMPRGCQKSCFLNSVDNDAQRCRRGW